MPICVPNCLQLNEFYTAHAHFPKVVACMKAGWEGCAHKWAWWGRLDILDLQANTNNPVERCFGLVKYTDLNRKTQSTINELVDTLLTKTVSRNMHNRALMLAGRATSGQQRQELRAKRAVEDMVVRGAVLQVAEDAPAGRPPGFTWVQGLSTNVAVCTGDLSCSCAYSGKGACLVDR
jgi:hypothetical protein